MSRCRCGRRLPCGCCETAATAPFPIDNPPGLASLQARSGRHPDVLAAMLARLGALPALRTRRSDDWTIALLDGWATVADVLSFYAERIANEAYLRTAVEHRSVVELARQIGYRPRPGVAAAVHLSFTLDPGPPTNVPRRSRARSVPGPGEQPQTFETTAAFTARPGLNRLGVRLERPPLLMPWTDPLHLAGTGLHLTPGDALVVRLDPAEAPTVRWVAAAREDLDRGTTVVSFDVPPAPPRFVPTTTLADLASALAGGVATAVVSEEEQRPTFPSTPTAGDVLVRTIEALEPALAGALSGAWATAAVGEQPTAQVWALRTRVPLFGHNAPPRLVDLSDGVPFFGEWTVFESGIESAHAVEDELVVDLDQPSAPVPAGSWVVVEYRGVDEESDLLPVGSDGERLGPDRPLVTVADAVEPSRSRRSYGMSGTVTRLRLRDAWIDLGNEDEEDFTIIRGTVVHAGAEELRLADEPIETAVAGDVLELDGYYDGIEAGRALVVAGERADLPGTSGVRAAEVVAVAEVAHATAADPELGRPGDPLHTYVRLRAPLRHAYRRTTAEVHGNVAHATHGETRVEVLGSGDAGLALQGFPLRSAPLTYESAPTPSGVVSTLEARVDGIRWHEASSLVGHGPADRAFTTEVAADATVTLRFGDGHHGARLPTGTANVRATYRQGIGAAGNVAAGSITVLATKPLGVREVVNPVPSTGGADPDGTQDVRTNAPRPLLALDRLVSLADYAAFAATFAGIGKADAAWVRHGGRRVVAVTVAGARDVPVEGDVVGNLARALRRWGDPELPVVVLVRRLLLALLGLRVHADPDHDPAVVDAGVRTALFRALGFDARRLGQDLTESEVLATVHAVPGVRWAHVDTIAGLRYEDGSVVEVPPLVVPPDLPYHPGRRVVAEGARTVAGRAAAAEVLYLAATVPEALTVEVVTP